MGREQGETAQAVKKGSMKHRTFSAALISIACSGCLATSVGTLAIDAHQTIGHARAGWTEYAETNPMLGSKPSSVLVAAYFSGCIGAVVLADRKLPRFWRYALHTVVTASQVKSIRHNILESRSP